MLIDDPNQNVAKSENMQRLLKANNIYIPLILACKLGFGQLLLEYFF